MAKRSHRRLRPDLFLSPIPARPSRSRDKVHLRQGNAQAVPGMDPLLAQAHTLQSQSAIIHQIAIPAAQRQSLAVQIGSAQGNRHLNGLLTGEAAPQPHIPETGRIQRDDGDQDTTVQSPGTPLQDYLVDSFQTAEKIAIVDSYAQDLDWIDSLEPALINQIDAVYQQPKQEAEFLKLLQKDKDSRKLIEQTRKNLPKGQRKSNAKLIEALGTASPEIKEQWDQFGSQLTKQKNPEESLFERPKEGVSWDVGRTMARIDFMATMTSILGTVDAVKNHFTKIKWFKIGGDNLLLYEPAGQRLELAAQDFETNYPGAHFPGTGTAQSLRGRHQHRESLGLYAHPLGIAVDYFAYENPHLKEKAFLLEVIGGGPSRMVFNDDQGKEYNLGKLRNLVSKMGKESAANLPEDQRDPKGKALLQQVDGAYNAMLQTSQNFQKSLGADAKNKLADLGKRYWETTRGQLGTLKKSLEKDHKTLGEKRQAAEKKILKRLAKEHSGELRDAKKQVREELKSQYKGKALDQQVELDPRVIAAKDALKASPQEIDQEAGVADLVSRIEQQEKQRDQLSEQVTKELTDILKPFTDIIDAKMAALNPDDKEFKKLDWLRKTLLTNFTYTFGEPEEKKNFKGSYYLRVDSPSILQLLEKGFIRYDPVPTPVVTGQAGSAPQGQGTFNAELFKTMMKYGWSPLAAAGAVDTMHFDFAEGFNLAANRGKISYGPLGIGPPKRD